MSANVHHTDSGHSAGPVLVVGATGRTGRQIVDRLVERHIPVRALVRDPEKGRELPADTRQFVGDLRRPDTLAEPLAGAAAMIVAASGSGGHDNTSELVDLFGTEHLVREAKAAGVGDVVYISSIHATRPEHSQDVEPDSLGWKARGEDVVRRSGLDYCVVRAGWLTDGPGGDPLELSQGDVAEGHLSRADLADVCVRALLLHEANRKSFEVVVAHGAEGVVLEEAVAGLTEDPVHRT